MNLIEKYTARVLTGREAQRVAGYLAVAGIHFEMEPLPFDAYEFTVSQSNGYQLDNACIAESPHNTLVMSGNQARVLMRKAIAYHVELEDASDNPIDNATKAALKWYEACAFPPVAVATEGTPHVVTCTDGDNTEIVYINVVEAPNGWRFTNALAGNDGIFGIQCEDAGPFESETLALIDALNQAVQYAIENDYDMVSVTKSLSDIHHWPGDQWERVADNPVHVYQRT